jgi:hypothetical protein
MKGWSRTGGAGFIPAITIASGMAGGHKARPTSAPRESLQPIDRQSPLTPRLIL